MPTEFDRRTFLKTASAAGVGTWIASRASPAWGAASSPNEKLVVAVVGTNGRGLVHAQGFASAANSEVAYICDVDDAAMAKGIATTSKFQRRAPKGVKDFRRVLDDKTVDAISIATPDHWHTPAAIMALKAGKHVYVEKPSGHNPREGELLVAAQQKYGKVVQMGNQQRSGPRSIEAMAAIREGAIGRAYYARAWYANARASIGRGTAAPVPAGLDYELWQGPAPRTPYRDNVIHYNWHWFRRWGTGEVCNNGTHEIDVCRWALGVDYPTRVTFTGGRYHFKDDWEFPDTQTVGFEFEGERAIVWNGQSCNGFAAERSGRGASIHGTEGTIVIDRNGYTHFDTKNKLVRENKGDERGDGLDTRAQDRLTDLHIANFIAAVRTGVRLNAPIEDGRKSSLLCHLGNIAYRTGHDLRIDPSDGHILRDADAQQLWSREYAPGWAPTV